MLVFWCYKGAVRLKRKCSTGSHEGNVSGKKDSSCQSRMTCLEFILE